MAQWDLTITVLITHKDKPIGWAEQIMNDDILDLLREREFSLVHTVEEVGIKAVKNALEVYDADKWGK